MTVGLVVHDLTGMDTLLVIDLPEDDTTVFGAAKAIAGRCMTQLRFRQIASRDYGTTKFRVKTETFCHDVRRKMADGRCFIFDNG